jgi:ferric-dicitrate binding protein FerR (iron transport regulator)
MNKPLHITDDLLISYLLNEVSAEQLQLIDEWRVQDAENQRRFEQFRLIWESSKNFKADTGIDAHTSLQKVKQRAAEAKEQRAKVVPMRKKYTWLKIAAAIFLVAGCGWIWFGKFANPQIQFESRAGVKTDTLSDGSIVTLNKFARLDYPQKFSGNQRLVTLVKGEAFFNIAHNKARPFIITTGIATIKVVGTSFNVKNKNGWVEVIVETGIVQVTNGRDKTTVILKAGDVASLNPESGGFIKFQNKDNLYTYYRSNELSFKNIPLPRLVAALNEIYGTNIIIGRKELNTLQMTGNLKMMDGPDTILKVIELTLNITAEKQQDKIVLK